MKKSLFLGLTLAMLSSSAWAYTNAEAGYSIKNEATLQNVVEADNFYAYTNYPKVASLKAAQGQTLHVVGVLTDADMEKIIGEPFTTEYFNQQYENLALLGRCELDLRTIPVAMLDLANYEKAQEQNVFARLLTPQKELEAAEIVAMQQAEKKEAADKDKEAEPSEASQEEQPFEPWVRADKLGKHRVITISQYYHQQQGLKEHILVAHTSLLSKDNKMYVLTTYNYETATPQSRRLEHKYFKESINERFPVAEAEKQLPLEPFAPKKKEDLNAKFSPELWQEHKDFVENFRYVDAKATKERLSFYDPVLEKSFALPKDWFYVQLKPEQQGVQDNLVLATSYSKFAQLFTEKKSTETAAVVEKLLLLLNSEESPLLKLDKEGTLQLAQNLDEMLVSSSFAIEDQDLAAILAQPQASQAEFELLLVSGMDRLHNMENGLYKIHSYGYETDFTKTQALADLEIRFELLDQYAYTSRLRFACQKDKGLLLSYIKKENLPNNTSLLEQIENWQF